MATFYLEVTSGGDVLAVDSNTALAYQTGSADGTLVTITPTLEAVGFDLPSDIDIFYKDATDSTWIPSNAAGRTFEVSLADGNYTYEAQLRYDADTPVIDENGSEVAIQTTTFTVGAAPSPVIGAVSIVETDGPTYDGDGTTEYTFTIDTSNADAVDLTYLWTVASVGGGTFDVTTPLTGTSIEVQFDDASTAYEINCTVSSATASDSPQDAAEVQITTEAAAADDWDTQTNSEFFTVLANAGAQTQLYTIATDTDEGVSPVNDTWTEFRGTQQAGNTFSTNDFGSITLPGGGNGYCVTSGNGQIPTTSKDYLAIYFSSGMIPGNFGRADNVGWVVYNREVDPSGAVTTNRQAFIPVEAYVFSDVADGDPGGPAISDTAFTTKAKWVFFDGYTPGSALSWTEPPGL